MVQAGKSIELEKSKNKEGENEIWRRRIFRILEKSSCQEPWCCMYVRGRYEEETLTKPETQGESEFE